MRIFYPLLVSIVLLISCGENNKKESTPILKDTSGISVEQENSSSIKNNPVIQQEQGPTTLFATERFGYREKTAYPFVVYYNGYYFDPTSWDLGEMTFDMKKLYKEAGSFINHSLKIGNNLYQLKNGKKDKVLSIKSFNSELGPGAPGSPLLSPIPNQSILTDNPLIGSNPLISLDKNDQPKLPKRSIVDVEGITTYYEDILLSKVDIDGDGIPEFIYECEDYEGVFYVIYSQKNKIWKKVYEGGYDGS